MQPAAERITARDRAVFTITNNFFIRLHFNTPFRLRKIEVTDELAFGVPLDSEVVGKALSPDKVNSGVALPRENVLLLEPSDGNCDASPARNSRALVELGQQFVVGLVLLERGSECFHGFDWIQVDHGAAQLTDGFDLLRREEFFLFPGAALGNVNRGE